MNLTLSKTISATALALIGYAIFASSAQASVTSQLNNCRYDSKQKVVDCCERVLRNEDKPMWMIESGRSCSSAAVCTGRQGGSNRAALTFSPNKKRCYVQIQIYENDGGKRNPNRQRRGNRSFN